MRRLGTAQDTDGELVPPGLYLVQIEVEIDLGVETQTYAVAVAY